MERIIQLLEEKNWQHKKTIYIPEIVRYRIPKHQRKHRVSCIVISNNVPIYIGTVLYQLKRYQDCEVVFVDNGNKSKLPVDMLNCGIIDIYISTVTDRGAYMARNIGALFATSPLLLFCDDDGIPDNNMVKAHIDIRKTYRLVSSCGCCKPLTHTPYNALVNHYYHGNKPFPYWPNLEGNCCIDANIFFKSNGWSDTLRFGGGGYELTTRMLSIQADYRQYAYIPDAILYHDYCQSINSLINKRNIQIQATAKRYNNTPDYLLHRDVFLSMYGQSSYLIHNNQ